VQIAGPSGRAGSVVSFGEPSGVFLFLKAIFWGDKKWKGEKVVALRVEIVFLNANGYVCKAG
jgi:hypothetical protein